MGIFCGACEDAYSAADYVFLSDAQEQRRCGDALDPLSGLVSGQVAVTRAMCDYYAQKNDNDNGEEEYRHAHREAQAARRALAARRGRVRDYRVRRAVGRAGHAQCHGGV